MRRWWGKDREIWQRPAVVQAAHDVSGITSGVIVGLLVFTVAAAILADRYTRWSNLHVGLVSVGIALCVGSFVATLHAPYKQRNGARKAHDDLKAEVDRLNAERATYVPADELPALVDRWYEDRQADEAAATDAEARVEAQRAPLRRLISQGRVRLLTSEKEYMEGFSGFSPFRTPDFTPDPYVSAAAMWFVPSSWWADVSEAIDCHPPSSPEPFLHRSVREVEAIVDRERTAIKSAVEALEQKLESIWS